MTSSQEDEDLCKKLPRDLDELKEQSRQYSTRDIQDGSWFIRFLAYALENYAETVDAVWFQRKSPGLPADAIADRRLALA